jgi:Holliday junction resolvasome RuvABC DNA-binding subunit
MPKIIYDGKNEEECRLSDKQSLVSADFCLHLKQNYIKGLQSFADFKQLISFESFIEITGFSAKIALKVSSKKRALGILDS